MKIESRLGVNIPLVSTAFLEAISCFMMSVVY